MSLRSKLYQIVDIPSVTMYEITLLGPFSVEQDGKPIRFASRKVDGLIAFLAVSGGLGLREELAQLLWPGADKKRALHSLAQALYSANSVAPGLIDGRVGGRVLLNDSLVKCDYKRLRGLLDRGNIPEASFLPNQFFPGAEIVGSNIFEHWVDRVRADVESRFVEASERWLKAQEDGGAWEQIDGTLQRLVKSGVGSTVLLRGAVLASLSLRDFDRAESHLRTYEDFADDRELVELRRLVERSRGFDPSIVDQEYEFPFVGRDSEFGKLVSTFRKAQRGMTVAEVVGTPGVGKTRLVQRFLRYTVLKGARVLHARASRTDSRTAYATIADLLKSGISSTDLSRMAPNWIDALGSAIPEVLDPNRAPPPWPADRRIVSEAVLQLLTQCAQDSPLVVCIDDLQWADRTSLALLHYVARRLHPDSPVLIIATFRKSSSPRVSFPSEKEVIELESFDRGAAELLISTVCEHDGLQLSGEQRTALRSYSGDHPLLLTVILQALVRQEVELSVFQRGLRSAPNELNQRIVSQLAPKITGLPPSARVVARGLATLVKCENLKTLSDVSGVTGKDLHKAIETLRTSGLTSDDGLRGIKFTHEVIRDVAYGTIPGPERRLFHRAAAASLCSEGEIQPSVVAVHYNLAGDIPNAVKYGLLAADAAERLHAVGEAEYFLRLAISGSSGQALALVQHRLARLLIRCRRFDEAKILLTNAQAKFLNSGDEQLALQCQVDTARILARTGGIGDSFIEQLEQLHEKSRELNAVEPLVWVLATLATLHLEQGRTAAASAASETLIRIGSGRPLDEIGIEATSSGWILRSLAGKQPVPATVFDEVIANAEKVGVPSLVRALVLKAIYQYRAGDLFGAQGSLDLAKQRSGGDERAFGYGLLNNYGVVLMERGRSADAYQLFSRACEIVEEEGLAYDGAHSYLNRAIVSLDLGELDGAIRDADKAIAYAHSMRSVSTTICALGIKGLVHLRRGDRGRARLLAREIMSIDPSALTKTQDTSHADMFVARFMALEGDSDKAVAYLDAALANQIDALYRLNILVMKSEILALNDPVRGAALQRQVFAEASQAGAEMIIKRFDAPPGEVAWPAEQYATLAT